MAAKSPSGSTVTLYRMGDHIDISQGPFMSSSRLLYRFRVCAVSLHTLHYFNDDAGEPSVLHCLISCWCNRRGHFHSRQV